MISFLPKKHIKLEDTIVTIAPKIYLEISNSILFEELYERVKEKIKINVADFTICLDYLFAINKIDQINGRIIKK